MRWSDPDTEDPSTPIDWPAASLILATLFMNFFFWMLCGDRVSMLYPLPL
jgi:hypothetical protein